MFPFSFFSTFPSTYIVSISIFRYVFSEETVTFSNVLLLLNASIHMLHLPTRVHAWFIVQFAVDFQGERKLPTLNYRCLKDKVINNTQKISPIWLFKTHRIHLIEIRKGDKRCI